MPQGRRRRAAKPQEKANGPHRNRLWRVAPQEQPHILSRKYTAAEQADCQSAAGCNPAPHKQPEPRPIAGHVRLCATAVAVTPGCRRASLPHPMPVCHAGGSIPKQSAGLLMYRRASGTLEVLLVHPGGPFWKNKDAGAWSIPKGEVGSGESPLDAAQREFREETGLPMVGGLIPLGMARQP